MSDTPRHADDTAILSAFAQQRRQGLTRRSALHQALLQLIAAGELPWRTKLPPSRVWRPGWRWRATRWNRPTLGWRRKGSSAERWGAAALCAIAATRCSAANCWRRRRGKRRGWRSAS